MKNPIKLAILITTCYAIFIAPSSASAQQNDSITADQFLQQASISSINEVSMGNLGLKRAQDSKIKDYAQVILNDHMVINAEIKALAKRKNIKLPDSMSIPINSMQTRVDTALSSPSVKQADTSKNKTIVADSVEANFDSGYMQMMIKDHQKAIDLFTQGSQNKDPDIQTFCLKYLPVLKRHLDDAASISKEMPLKK
jgi:putative membrane protein